MEFRKEGYRPRWESRFVEPGSRIFVEVNLFPDSSAKATPKEEPDDEPESDSLVADLDLAHGDGRFARLFKMLTRVDLLILDDWGLAPITADQGRDLLEVLDDRNGDT